MLQASLTGGYGDGVRGVRELAARVRPAFNCGHCHPLSFSCQFDRSFACHKCTRTLRRDDAPGGRKKRRWSGNSAFHKPTGPRVQD
jgi:hypothetical protein